MVVKKELVTSAKDKHRILLLCFIRPSSEARVLTWIGYRGLCYKQSTGSQL